MKLTQQNLAILIFTLFAIVTTVGFLFGIGDYLIKEQLPIDACWISVQIQSALEPRVAMEEFRINLKCPPQDNLIKESLDDWDGQQAAKRHIAEAMRHCWYKFGEGEAELFREDNVYCAVCEWIEFEDKGKKFKGMPEYLSVTPMLGSRKSYYDYLLKYKRPGFEQYLNEDELERNVDDLIGEMDSDKLYSVMFVYARGESSMNKLKDSIGLGGAFIAGSLFAKGAGSLALYGISQTAVGGFLLGLPTVGAAAPFVVTVGAVAVGVAATLATFIQSEPKWIAMTTLVEHSEDKVEKLACNRLLTTKIK